ncbi:MAG TPA: amidase, partial [Brevibacterium sp.]|nr:amidase [Brevibacterium sp.]
AVKDVIDVAGYPTSMGSAVDTGRGDHTTADVVAALEAAGGLTVAKTNCQEFSYGILGEESAFGTVVNPRGADLCTAGSSSGSAALVAAGAVPLAIGTDTAGSVRVPAACTGTLGFKPTFGLVPVEGVFPLAPSCDTVGFFALDVGLIRRAFLAARADGGYPVAGGQGPAGAPRPLGRSTDGAAATGRVLRVGEDSAAGRLLDSVIEETLRLYEPLRKYEAYQIHRELLETQGDRYQPVVRQRALAGAGVSRAEYEDARAGQEAVRASALRLFDDADLICTAAIDGTVPTWAQVGPRYRDAFTRYSTPFNVLGWPAITVPVAGDAVGDRQADARAEAGDAGEAGEARVPLLSSPRGGAAVPAETPRSHQLVGPPHEDLALLDSAERFLHAR